MTKGRKIVVAASACCLMAAIAIANLSPAEAGMKVKLNRKKVTIKVGKTKKIKVKNLKGKKVKWKTSNKKIATVKKSGKKAAVITAKKAGTVTITAKVGKKSFKCKVTVKGKAFSNDKNVKRTDVGKVTADTITSSLPHMFVGESIDMFSTDEFGDPYIDVKYKLNNTEKASLFKFTSSDKKIATVNKYGVVTGRSSGTATITIKVKSSSGWQTFKTTIKILSKSDVLMEVETSIRNTELAELAKPKMIAEGCNESALFDTVTLTITNNSDNKMVVSGIRLYQIYTWTEVFYGDGSVVYSPGLIENDLGYRLFSPTNFTIDERYPANSGYDSVKIPAHSSKTYIFKMHSDTSLKYMSGLSENSHINVYSSIGSFTYHLKNKTLNLI